MLITLKSTSSTTLPNCHFSHPSSQMVEQRGVDGHMKYTTLDGITVEVDLHYSRGDPYTGIPSGWEIDDITPYIELSDEDWKRIQREAEEQASEI